MTDLLTLSTQELEDVLIEVAPVTEVKSKLVVYNDDFNTFDWVIQCFIEVCGHTFEQSEQLSLIVHFKGKAVVKTGERNVLVSMKEELINRGLSAAVETEVEQ